MAEPTPTRAQRHTVHFSGRLERLDREANDARILDVHIVDLSTGGAALEASEHLEPGSTWIMRLDPLLGSSFSETVVIRSCFAQESGDYRCGVQFISAVQLFVQAGIDLQSVISDLGEQATQQAVSQTASSESCPTAGAVSFKEHAHAHALQNVRIYASQSLTVTGDLVECDAKLEGPLSVEGAIMGGQIETNNAVQAGSLGHSDYPTHIIIGADTKANAVLEQVPQQLAHYEQIIRAAEAELAELKEMGSNADHAMRERTMELEFELPELIEKREALQAKYEQVLSHFQSKLKIDLRVQHAIGANTTIAYDGKIFRATETIDGPLRIVVNENAQLEAIDAEQNCQPLSALMTVEDSEPAPSQPPAAAA